MAACRTCNNWSVAEVPAKMPALPDFLERQIRSCRAEPVAAGEVAEAIALGPLGEPALRMPIEKVCHEAKNYCCVVECGFNPVGMCPGRRMRRPYSSDVPRE